MGLELIFLLIQLIIAVLVFIGTISLITRKGRSLAPVFFAFALACVILSDVYWLAYDFLRPDTRMPFAANEISEWALFLLLGESLRAGIAPDFSSAKREVLGAALFAAASAGLWIAWSGEWMQDILTGAAYGYLLCCLTASLKHTGAFSASTWRAFAGICLVLVASQAAIFFTGASLAQFLDLFCYALMFAALVFIIIKIITAFRSGAGYGRLISLSYAYLAWAVTVMYMSAGVFYSAASILSVLGFPIMYMTLRREDAEA